MEKYHASRFNNETGEWKHFDNLEYRERKWLGNISYASGKFEFRQKNSASRRDLDFKGVLSEARSVLEEAKKRAAKRQVSDQRILFGEGQVCVRSLTFAMHGAFMVPRMFVRLWN